MLPASEEDLHEHHPKEQCCSCRKLVACIGAIAENDNQSLKVDGELKTA
jgi:hypothetical protein